MWYGLAAVRHQHMPGQCAFCTVASEVGKDRVVSVRDGFCGAGEPSSASCYDTRALGTIFSLC